MIKSERMLVTGGSGYIASFYIAHLLGGGAQVRTTVRSAKRGAGMIRAAVGKLVKADNRRLGSFGDVSQRKDAVEKLLPAKYPDRLTSELDRVADWEDGLFRPSLVPVLPVDSETLSAVSGSGPLPLR